MSLPFTSLFLLVVIFLFGTVTAHPRQYVDDINSIDEQVPLTTTRVPDKDAVQSISGGIMNIYPSYSRHAREITNEKKLYNLEILSFRITINSLIDNDKVRVKEAITLSMKNGLKLYFNDYISSTISDVTIQEMPQARLLKKSRRHLVQVNTNGKSIIDVHGGSATFFGTLLDQVSEEELNEAIREMLGAQLGKNDLFNQSKIVVGDIAAPAPASPPELPKTEDIIVGNNGGMIAIGVISAISVLAAGAYYGKRKYGLSLPRFRGSDNFNERHIRSREMKRDPYFDDMMAQYSSDTEIEVRYLFSSP